MKKVKQIIAIMILFFIPFMMIAQPPHPNGGNIPGPGNTPVGGGQPCAPIDGGLGILLALGLTYGARKIFKVKREG